jgi:hypothetical protein
MPGQKREARLHADWPGIRASLGRWAARVVTKEFSYLLPVTIGTRGEDHEPRNYESF